MATVLVVCTGNICRSPAAELVLERRLGPSVTVRSAGTNATDGDRMSRAMRAEVRAGGLDGRAHRARRLTRTMVDDADLVIAMTQQQRTYVELLTAGASERTFVLGHLAAIASGGAVALPGESAAERLLAVPSVAWRALGGTVHRSEHDTPDPFGGPRSGYRESFSTLRTLAGAFGAWVLAGDSLDVSTGSMSGLR